MKLVRESLANAEGNYKSLCRERVRTMDVTPPVSVRGRTSNDDALSRCCEVNDVVLSRQHQGEERLASQSAVPG
jgi:hypothetical protein